MQFESPKYLLLLILVLALAALWFYLDKKRNKSLVENFSQENRENLGLISSSLMRYKILSRFFFLLALSLLALALARPQQGHKQKSMLATEHSVVFVVDVSRSMLTKDISPSRLAILKTEIIKTLENLADIRVGLVVFAGSVDVISPMTSDLNAISSYVDSLSVDSVISQGTNIKAALLEAEGLFSRSLGEGENAKESNKIILVFSDGEDHQEDTLEVASQLSDKGYHIFTVGVGSESGGYVPEGEGVTTYIKDYSGQPVVSKPNFDFLKQLSNNGNGAFYYLSPIEPLAEKIKKSVSKIQGVATSKRKFIVKNELFQIFIISALIAALLGYWLRRIRD